MFDFSKEFIERLKEQDHAAFNEFYLKTVDIFFRYIKNHYFVSDEDCNDVVATFFVKQRSAFKTIDINQSFSAFVRTVFKNTLKDYFKKLSDTPFSFLDEEDDKESFEDKLEDETDMTELMESDFKMEQIQEAMLQLDETSKDIVYLKFIEEKSNQEIADQLMMSADNVRQKLSRAIKALKQLLITE